MEAAELATASFGDIMLEVGARRQGHSWAPLGAALCQGGRRKPCLHPTGAQGSCMPAQQALTWGLAAAQRALAARS